MLVLLSPAKDLNFEPAALGPDQFTAPRLADDIADLSDVTNTLTRQDLRDLMGISDKLADLNFQRFQDLSDAHQDKAGLMAAAFAFAGDVYRGLDARSLSADDMAFAQTHVRHLSGLYGLLRPLDAIAPYRLEMGTRLKTPRGNTLYEFWGRQIADTINADLDIASPDDRVVLNLASEEYFKAVDKKALNARVISVGFKDIKDGKARSLFMFVKRARGLMTRWVVENRITNPADLAGFDVEGYTIDTDASSDDALVFTRPQPAKKAA